MRNLTICVQAQAGVALFICIALAALFPIVEYMSILRADSNVSIAYPACIWAGSALIFAFGGLAYYLMMPILLGLHAGVTAIAGAAMVVCYTMVWFSADARCTFQQSTIIGCTGCACAIASVCNAVRPVDLLSNAERLANLQCNMLNLCWLALDGPFVRIAPAVMQQAQAQCSRLAFGSLFSKMMQDWPCHSHNS